MIDLSAEGLQSEVVSGYDIASPVDCALLHSGLNEIYRIKTGGGPLILKLYRAGWRTQSEIMYEIEVLLHLGREGVPVSLPLARRDGSFAKTFQGPEGIQHMVLFTDAPGQPEELLTEQYCYRFGGAAAEMHRATDGFTSPHARFHLDLAHLLEQPLNALQPVLAQRPEDWNYLRDLSLRLRDGIGQAPADALDWGHCHGDLAPNNAHVWADTLTLFDFDCGGPGWRAYDVALFRAFLADESQRYGNHEQLWQAFLLGYTERRPLDAVNLSVVPIFVAMRQIWVLGVHAHLASRSGSPRLPGFFDWMLRFLKVWESEHLPVHLPHLTA